MAKGQILLIEDDPEIYQIVKAQIELLGYELDYAPTGTEGLEKALAKPYSLTIIDRTLPGLGGLEILREIRKTSESRQVLLLTSLGSEIDKVLGLELGADDYVLKPFSLPELVARIRARLRTAESQQAAPAAATIKPQDNVPLRFGDLSIDLVRRHLAIRGVSVELTALEFDLVAFLAQQAGVPFDRSALLEAVWGCNIPEYEANVNVTMNRVRRKIETDPQQPKYLLTVRGVGYKWCDPDGGPA